MKHSLYKQILSCIMGVVFLTTLQESSFAQKYWVSFKDKKNNGYSLNHPEKFLSRKALERRKRGNTFVTFEDLPVSKRYIDSIKTFGLEYIHCSKWFNGALFRVLDETKIEKVRSLGFVETIEKRESRTAQISQVGKFNVEDSVFSIFLSLDVFYGIGINPILQLNGTGLHNLGYRGKGICIAIIDAGFNVYNKQNVFDSLILSKRILGYKDFVEPGNKNFNKSTHGTIVLGTMAANIPGYYVGIAPDASYWLLRSENTQSEYPSEEDNWMAAIEFADSAGVDLVNTSLGYKDFDDPVFNHSNKDLNGKTLRISRAAKMASDRGMLLTISAGNNGNSMLPYIGAPADAYGVLTVGAVDPQGNIASFSSRGFGERIKPDIVAQGMKVASFNDNGWIGNATNGTSFSSPIAGAMSACLIQAFPNATVGELIDAIKSTASHSQSPDSVYGYGIPDFQAAYQLLSNKINPQSEIKAFPSPASNYLYLIPGFKKYENVRIECFYVTGQKIFDVIRHEKNIVLLNEIQSLRNGIYFIRCTSEGEKAICKISIIKQP